MAVASEVLGDGAVEFAGHLLVWLVAQPLHQRHELREIHLAQGRHAPAAADEGHDAEGHPVREAVQGLRGHLRETADLQLVPLAPLSEASARLGEWVHHHADDPQEVRPGVLAAPAHRISSLRRLPEPL